MAKLSGNQGSVTCTSTGWGTGVVVASISNWKFDYDAHDEDVTTFASAGFPEYMNTNKGGSGSFDMFSDDTTALAVATSSNPTLVLILHGSDRKITGTAVLSKLGTGADGGGKPQVSSFSFKYTGSWTIV